MKTLYLSIILISIASHTASSQRMYWSSSDHNKNNSLCQDDYGKSKDKSCWNLVYVPNTSGTLTSYTTTFYASCTSKGSPVIRNQSCSMNSNIHLFDGCGQLSRIIMGCAGNTGNVEHNKVEAGKAFTLHQVCFTIPQGETVSLTIQDPLDLNTSITGLQGEIVTEYPVYDAFEIRTYKGEIRPEPSILDFHVADAGHLIAQLDWSVRAGNQAGFVVEHSSDHLVFKPIHTLSEEIASHHIRGFQYFDRAAQPGKNYYRIKEIQPDGQINYSAIRTVEFGPTEPEVSISPNPAQKFIDVEIQNPWDGIIMRIIDSRGQIAIEVNAEDQSPQGRIDIERLPPGIYTLHIAGPIKSHTATFVKSN